MNSGVIFAAIAYIIWGLFPLYFKAMYTVPAMEILGHRFFGSFIFLTLVQIIRRDWKWLKPALQQPKVIIAFCCAALVLAVNWLTYVWGVISGYVVETSLGYFINPLVNVLLGVILLRERLRFSQWMPIGLATAGVVYLTLYYGRFPWIALVLATSFAIYGLLKKLSTLNSIRGLWLETTLMALPTLSYLIFLQTKGTAAFIYQGRRITLLLVLAGVVTAIPLIFFSTGAQRIPLSVLGLLQFISPTMQFFLGVFVYHEVFTLQHTIGFSLIWIALIFYSGESLLHQRKIRKGNQITSPTL